MTETDEPLAWSDRIVRLIKNHYRSYQRLANKIGLDCDSQTVRRWISGTNPSRFYRARIEQIEIEKGYLKAEDVEN